MAIMSSTAVPPAGPKYNTQAPVVGGVRLGGNFKKKHYPARSRANRATSPICSSDQTSVEDLAGAITDDRHGEILELFGKSLIRHGISPLSHWPAGRIFPVCFRLPG